MVLILAAGDASRMGSVKQLLPFNNTTLIQTVIKNALGTKANKVFCVLGANIEVIKNEVKTDSVTFISNTNWKEGLSSSIVAGISFFQTSKIDTFGCFLGNIKFLGD